MARDPEYHKKWAAKNADRLREYKRQHYLKNKSRYLSKMRQWAADHPDVSKRIKRKSFEKHRDSVREKSKQWKREHPEVVLAWLRDRQARKRSATVDSSAAIFIKRTKRLKAVKCYYCGTNVKGSKTHIDHIIPLASGGAHTASNLCATCPTCNMSKGAKSLAEWNKLDQLVFSI